MKPRRAMPRTYLYLAASLIWGIPGARITLKGVAAYGALPHDKVGWLAAISAIIALLFFHIFRHITTRYRHHIASLSDAEIALFRTFTPRGWRLLCVMIALGIAINALKMVPTEFIAAFYCGLGPMLLLSSLRFFAPILQKNHPKIEDK